MTPTIAETAHAVLAGSARNDDAKKLARWVLERCETERAPEPEPEDRPLAYHPCGCIAGFMPCGHEWGGR